MLYVEPFYKFEWQDFDNQYLLWQSVVVKLGEFHGILFHGTFPLHDYISIVVQSVFPGSEKSYISYDEEKKDAEPEPCQVLCWMKIHNCHLIWILFFLLNLFKTFISHSNRLLPKSAPV